MSYLVGEIGVYLLAAAVLGALIGWFLYRCKCNKAIAAIEQQKLALNTELSTTKEQLAATQQQLNLTQQQLQGSESSVIQLRSNVAQAEGNAFLMQSRWQSTLKQARQAPNQLKWIQSLQSKLANKNIQLQQNRQFAEAKAWEAQANRENLTRVHTRLTQVDAQVANLKDWVSVFQTKLVKTKTDHAQLRSYADNTQLALNANKENLSRTHKRLTQVDAQVTNLKDWVSVFQTKLMKTKTDHAQLRSYADNTQVALDANKENLVRTHQRLTEIEHKQQPLRTWIRVFQTKLMKTKSDYAQLRSYADNMQTTLSANEDNLTRTHTRLSEMSQELQESKHHTSNIMPSVTPPADVSDNTTLRLVDRIRLLGTSKKSVYGRMHNQIREAKLETIETERVLTDSCEEKDAIIDDLRVQLRKAENRAQKAPVVQLDQSVKIKELETQLAQASLDIQAGSNAQTQMREHQLTIDAYRSKLQSTKNQFLTQHAQPPTAAPRVRAGTGSESEPNSGKPDDLKLIKGVGPKLEKLLNELGIHTFSQIAAWSQSDIEEISTKLGSFKDRVTRDDWVSKARELDSNN